MSVEITFCISGHDEEIDALTVCATVLNSLREADAAARVAHYLTDRYPFAAVASTSRGDRHG